MPEGDSVANDAARLRPLLDGLEVISVDGTSGSVRSNARHIRGATVLGIRTYGKNLLVDFDTGFSLHVHLEMNGRWLTSGPQERVGGPAKILLETEQGKAACYSAPIVRVDRTPRLDLELRRLGPDLLGEWSVEEVISRARTVETDPLGRVLLNQRVAAGIGNVYKSELAFLAGINPFTPVERISDQELSDMYANAAKLLRVNVGKGTRSTTGEQGRGRTLWVYDRAGLSCLRCMTAIRKARLDDRVTYWCPACQPEPAKA